MRLIASIAISLALAAGPAAAQGPRESHSSTRSQRAVNQIERAAARVVHADLLRRGVTDWSDVGFDPNVDAHMISIRPARDPEHAQVLVSALGGRRVSAESVRSDSPDCGPGIPARIVYLDAPLIMGDSAAIQITYALKATKNSCHFSFESRTFAFIRHDSDWFYVGIQGRNTSI